MPEQPVARRYRVVRLLGKGGQGAVWQAVDELTGAAVAVKLVPEANHKGASKREVAVLRALRLPGVVRLLDEGRWEDQHYIVTELVHGIPFPGHQAPALWEDLATPTRTLLEALGHVHRAGVAHGDLKPANVLVDDQGRAHLLDFGMAQADAQVLRPDHSQPLGGTLHYLAPEVIDGRRPDLRADLFAVGVMLCRSLSGQVPWLAADLRKLVTARMDHPPTLPPALGHPVPAQVEDALAALLSLDRVDRPASAADALHALGLARREEALPLPWDEHGPSLVPSELAAVFVGPERVLHLPSDAAALLHQATGGHRQRVAEELRAWVSSGLAHPVGDQLRVERERLVELRSQGALPLGLPTAAPAPGDSSLRAVLSAMALAAEHAHSGRLAHVLGIGPTELQALLTRLVACGAAEQDADGRWWDRTAGACLVDLDAEQRCTLHATVADALPSDEPARLPHLLASQSSTATIVQAATSTTHHWLRAGRLADALAAAELAFQLLRSEPYGGTQTEALLDAYTLAALTTETPPTLARAAWELRRLPHLPGRDARAALLDASLHALSGRAQQALELATALPEFADPDVGLWVAAVEIQAARHLPVQGEEFVLQQVQRWVHEHPGSPAEARLAGWLGHLRQREGNHQQAAELHAQAARGRLSLHERVAAVLHEAEALVEGGHLGRARQQAMQARVLASEARDTLLEAKAWHLERQVAARRRDTVPPDEDLVEAIHHLGEPGLSAKAAFTEAVIARHQGYVEACARLAMRAKAGFHATGRSACAVLAAAVAADAGEATALWWARQQFATVDAREEPLRMLQTCALLHSATAVEEWAAAGRLIAEHCGPVDPDRMLEVLQFGEALELIGFQGPAA